MHSLKRQMRLPGVEIVALLRDEIVDRFGRIAGDENGFVEFHEALVWDEEDIVFARVRKVLVAVCKLSGSEIGELMLHSASENVLRNRGARKPRFEPRIEQGRYNI